MSNVTLTLSQVINVNNVYTVTNNTFTVVVPEGINTNFNSPVGILKRSSKRYKVNYHKLSQYLFIDQANNMYAVVNIKRS